MKKQKLFDSIKNVNSNNFYKDLGITQILYTDNPKNISILTNNQRKVIILNFITCEKPFTSLLISDNITDLYSLFEYIVYGNIFKPHDNRLKNFKGIYYIYPEHYDYCKYFIEKGAEKVI